jgi:hypothetical protein
MVWQECNFSLHGNLRLLCDLRLKVDEWLQTIAEEVKNKQPTEDTDGSGTVA